jgi:putative ABC transport system ATP-binding protein
MSLLELEHISKHYWHGSVQLDALRDVSLELHPAELAVVWGPPRSGRSTLLRIAAGIEAPDSGRVRFGGRAISTGEGLERGIACALKRLRGADGRRVIEELISTQLALGASPSNAKTQAWSVLERAGIRESAQRRSHELDGAEAMRASIATALARRPLLLVVDEPTAGVDLMARGGIFALLRSLTRDGIAVLTTVGESTGLFGADRALSLCEGELHGDLAPELAQILSLPLRASG